LGLPTDNTPAQRAKAMGFDTDVYHGSKQDFDKFKGDQPVFAAEDPDIAGLYGNAIYPLKLRGEVLEVSDLGKDGASGRFSNNLAKELKIPRKELEDLRMPKPLFDDSSVLERLESLFIKKFGDPSFSDIGEREMVNKLPKHGIDRLKVTDMSDMGGNQTQHMIPAGSDNIRSRFAAFDPFRKDAAIAAAMGVLAPDLLAKEKEEGKARGGLAMAEGGNVLKGNILAGASWNSLNKTLGNELTTLTGQPTLNTSVGGATTAETYKQLMDFINNGGSFDPKATVFLQTGGVDFITGVPREEVKSNIEQIISVLGDQGVNVVLTGAPYAASMEDVINNNFDPRIDPLFEEIAAANPNVALVDSMGDILQDKSLLSDAIHTNETGTRRYNDDVIGALTALQQRESPVQGGREAETIIPQEVERITQPTIEQEFEQKMSDPVKQDFQEEIIQKETPEPADVKVEVQDPVEQVAVQEVAAPSVPDYSRAYEALGGADVVNGLRDQLLGMGIDESIIADSFSKYYPKEYEQEFAQEMYKRGGAVGQESPEDMARFHKRFAMHKAIGGSVKKMAGGMLTNPVKWVVVLV
jgi:hypothetical protein